MIAPILIYFVLYGNSNHQRVADSCNFLSKRVLMRQQSRLVVAKDLKYLALFKCMDLFPKTIAAVYITHPARSSLSHSHYITPPVSLYLPNELGISFNSLRPRENRRHFADDVFKCNFLNENVWILIKISLKFVPKGPINNIPALVQIMAWRRPGDKPLSEAMMVRLPTHICVIRPQWVNV